MAKKKKNSNYVTQKNDEKRAQKLRDERKKKNKNVIKAILVAITSVAVIAGIGLGICYLGGAFDYTPEVTYHASIEIEDYGTLHVELYGNDAPKTVENFVKLANNGYFNGTSFHKIIDGLVYGGSVYADGGILGVKGEFSDNGVENKISHTRGTLSMARGEGDDTGYSQFFVVAENSRELDGKYAAFGRITSGMEIIDKIYEEAERSESGTIAKDDIAIIKSITTHESHSH